MSSRPHVAMLATHGMGHIIPLAELAKLLVRHHNLSVTLLVFPDTSSKAQNSFLASLPPFISSRSLPPVDLSDLPPNTSIETFMSLSVHRSVPNIERSLSDLKSTLNLVAFVADLFGADAFDAAYSLSIPPYLFMPSNFLLLSLSMNLPDLDRTVSGDLRDLSEPIRLPGCVPIPGPDVVDSVHSRSKDCYEWLVHHSRRYWEAKGILVNSFPAVEPGAVEFLTQRTPGRPPVYPVGPLSRTEPEGGHECLEWLDRQPAGSVLYVSFGSGGTLTTDQTVELALGLEMSGQRFLWVVRCTSDVANSAYFDPEGGPVDPVRFLPTGFVERVRQKGVGFLVPGWAPQVAVLGHGATGGFLTHCGWNSTLEGILGGVAMVAWPLFAEQRQNAVMLTEGAKVAVRVEAGKNGVVGREEVARVVRMVMEGEEGKEMKRRVEVLKEAAVKGLESGGVGFKALADVAEEWKKQ